MHRGSDRLVLVSVLLCTVLLAGVSAAEISLVEPTVSVTEGDRVVELEWSDPAPASLVAIGQPRLGSAQYPWRGKAAVEAGGFYHGACDWTYLFSMIFFTDSTTLAWDEITNWETKSTRKRYLALRETDHAYSVSDSLEITIPSAGLFTPSFAGWTGAHPVFSGIYRGGTPADSAVLFQFACSSGGQLGDQPGSAVRLDWTNALGQS
jgi:hypothetical protein